MYFGFKKYEAVSNTDNNQKYFLSSKSFIRVISEGSCGTEDWSNDAENTDLITEINYILHYKLRKAVL